MKLIKAKEKPFTIEDFEKGLMLAGYIPPSSVAELHEKNELDSSEAKQDSERSKLYFKRAVLAAEIAYHMHTEPTFGHVKFQKMVYLCENVTEMQLNNRYSKQAAGPYDRKFMHSIDTLLEKNKWFKAELISQNNIKRFKYSPLHKCTAYKQYYTSYFNDYKSSIDFLINTFKNEKTDLVEKVATIYACIIELNENKIIVNDQNLLSRFYDWSKEKSRFPEKSVLSTLAWMKEKEILPK